MWSGRQARAFTLRRCRRCRLVFTAPRLSPDEIDAFYEARYYGIGNIRFRALIERWVLVFERRRADTIGRLVPTGRALDIGCGRGHTLRLLRQRGWKVTGVELHEAAAAHARAQGLDVLVGPAAAERIPSGSQDAVILWHVLEHLADPLGAIRELARILRPGGLVAVAVPNFSSWQARLTREHWFHLDLPRHYSHFSQTWLATALQRAGLRVIRVHHMALEHNLFGWIQSLLNCCGLPSNLLYDMLKSPSARTIRRPWRTYPVSAVLSALGLGLLWFPACGLVLTEAIARRGATIELYARKECVT